MCAQDARATYQFLSVLLAKSLVMTVLTTCAFADGPSSIAGRGMPQGALDELRIFQSRGISAFAVAPNGGYVIVTNDGRYVARNTPPDFSREIKRCIESGQRVLSVAFTAGDGWVIVGERNIEAARIPPGCFQRIGEMSNRGENIQSVGFGANNSWVVVSDRSVFHGNLFPMAAESLQGMANGPGVRGAFLSLYGPAYVFAKGTQYSGGGGPLEFQESIERATVNNEVIDIVVFAKNGGWVVISSGMR